MKETEIIQGNKLIAEFMGVEIQEVTKRDIMTGNSRNEFKFHSSWDWLMPVVEKIWKMGKMISIIYYTEGGGIVDGKIYNWGLGDPYQNCDGKEPITVVWKTVVQFITWYNSQPPSKVG